MKEHGPWIDLLKLSYCTLKTSTTNRLKEQLKILFHSIKNLKTECIVFILNQHPTWQSLSKSIHTSTSDNKKLRTIWIAFYIRLKFFFNMKICTKCIQFILTVNRYWCESLQQEEARETWWNLMQGYKRHNKWRVGFCNTHIYIGRPF